MSKILKNNSGSLITLSDVGVSIPNASNYTIATTDYLLFAGSDDVVTQVGNGNLVVNDGSSDLTISDGIDLIKGLFPKEIITSFNEASLDAFGRQRVSEINNIFESTHTNTDQSDFWDTSLTGGATTNHDLDCACVNLNVGTASGDKAIRQTFNHFHYAAGESFLVRITTILGTGETNLTKHVGYGDDDNGLFFGTVDDVFGITIRTDTSGTPVDQFIPSSSFNHDTLDGNGPSGVTIDLTKTQLFEIDFQWLGVGTIRFFVHIDGKQILVHKEDQNSNIKDVVYLRTPHQPVRYEIKNTGVTTQSNTLKQICTQVANEGNAQVGDIVRSVDMDTSFINVASSSFKPILSFRVDPNNYKVLVEFIAFNFIVSTNDDVLFQIVVDGTLTGGAWSDVDGLAEVRTPTSISGGYKLGSQYVSKSGGTGVGNFSSKFRLGSYIDNTPQTITVVAKAFAGSANVGCSIAYKEIF